MATEKNNNDEKNVILDDERDLLMNHEYDGIQELDNPMPPWWIYGFYLTIIFAVGYLMYYEVLGWGPTQEEEYQMEMAEAIERYGLDPETGTVVQADYSEFEILSDEASLAAGRALYQSPNNLCQTCHGPQGQGLVGPNLTDNYWKSGCDLESIIISIKEGFPARGMQPYGSGMRLSDEELQQLSSYIISIRGTDPPNPKAPNMSRAEPCEI